MAEQFYAQNREAKGAGFDSQSRLSTYPFGVFRGFLRNSRKYGLGFLRKTPHGGHSTYSPRSHKRTIGLKLTITITIFYFSLSLLLKQGYFHGGPVIKPFLFLLISNVRRFFYLSVNLFGL